MAEKFVLTAQLHTQLNVSSVKATVRQLRSLLSGIKIDLDVTGADKVRKEMRDIETTTKKTNKEIARGGNLLGDFGKAGALAAKRFAAFSIATAGFIAFVSAIKNGIKEAVNFERQMIRISQVTGTSMSHLRDLQDEITRLSTGLGVSSEKLVDISRTLAQTGMSARDTKIALEALAKTELAPTFTNITKTTEAAIAAMRQFNIEAGNLEKTLGQMNALAGSFAVEADDLGVVIRRAGGAFKSAGGSLIELEALFTSVRSTTRESAETIATGFRTIFTRMRRPKTIEYLKELGINLEDLSGKFVGPYEAVRRLNAALSELDPRDTRYAAIIEQLGGFRQVSKVIPLIQQFEQAELARQTAMRGGNSLTRDAITAQDALAVRLMKVKESFAELMRQIMDNKGIQIFIDLSLRMAEALIKVVSALEPLIPLIAVLGASALFKGMGRLGAGMKGGLGFAKGGVVPGTGNTDSVPANLTPGEFVIRKGAASRIGTDNLHAMNKYAAGGVVRKGRSAYGTATFKVGSAAAPKVGAFFMRPDEKDTLSREGAGRTVPSDKLNPEAINLLNAKTGNTGTSWLKKHKVRVQSVKAQMLLGPPESDTIDKISKKKSEEAILDISDDLIAKFSKAGLGPSKKSLGSIEQVDFKSIAGHVFEGVLAMVSSSILEGGSAGWDYKRPIPWKQLGELFGSTGKADEWKSSVVAMDAKRTQGDNATDSLNTKVANAFKTAQKGKESNVTMAELGMGVDDVILSGVKGKKKGKKGTPMSKAELATEFGMNKGGVVDSVPALLTPGEFVVNKASAQAIGYGNLKGMNKYAAGGIVRKGRGNYGRMDPFRDPNREIPRTPPTGSKVITTTGSSSKLPGMPPGAEKFPKAVGELGQMMIDAAKGTEKFAQALEELRAKTSKAIGEPPKNELTARRKDLVPAGGGYKPDETIIDAEFTRVTERRNITSDAPKPKPKPKPKPVPPPVDRGPDTKRTAAGGMEAMGKFMALEMAMGMAAGFVDAESALGKMINAVMKATAAMMMLGMFGGGKGIMGKIGGFGGSMGSAGKAMSTRGMLTMGGGLMDPAVKPTKLARMQMAAGGAQAKVGRGIKGFAAGKHGQKMGQMMGPAMMVGMIGSELGGALKDSGLSDIANEIGAGGEVSAATEMKTVGGGALAGAAIGGAIGMMLPGGPLTAAIGALIGGAIGAGMALVEMADAIEAAKINLSSKNLSDQMRNVEKGWADAASVGPQLGETFRMASAGKSGDEETKKAAGEAVKAATPAMEKFIKVIEKDATSMGEFMSRVDESTLRTYAELNSIPYDKLKESIEKNIAANAAAKVAAEKQKQAALHLEKMNRQLQNFNVAVEVTSDAIEVMGSRARASAGGRAGFADLSKGLISRPGDLSKAEMTGRTTAHGTAPSKLEQEIKSLTGSLGGKYGGKAGQKAGDDLAKRAIEGTRALGGLKDSLIATRTDLGTGGLGDDDDPIDLVMKNLGPGIGEDARKSLKAGLDQTYSSVEGQKALKEAIENGKLDEVIANASKGIKTELETLKKIAKLINDTTKAMEGAYKARLAIEKKLVGEIQKLHGMEKSRIAKMSQLRTGKGITPEQSADTFESQQADLLVRQDLGGLQKAGGGVDVGRSIEAFHKLNEAIRTNEMAQREGAGSGKAEMDRRIELMKANAKMREQVGTLNTVLRNYQNIQERGAALEAKIQKIKQDNAMRLGGVDAYIGATDEARREMDKVATLANQVASGTTQFADIPQELRGQVMEMMKKFSKVEGPQGAKFKEGVVQTRLAHLRKQGIDITPEREALVREEVGGGTELEGLINKLGAMYKEAEEIQAAAFIKANQDQIKNLDKDIKNIGEEFAKTLNKVFLTEQLAHNVKQITQWQAELAKLTAMEAALNKLAGMGVDVNDPASLRAAKSLAGEKGKEGLAEKTRRLEKQVKMAGALGQTGDQGDWRQNIGLGSLADFGGDKLTTDIIQGDTSAGGMQGVSKQMFQETGRTVMDADAATRGKFADRMMEMTKASMALEQVRADVAETGQGGAELAQMEAALRDMAQTGRGDFETVMKDLAEASGDQGSAAYFNALSGAVEQGIEKRGQESRSLFMDAVTTTADVTSDRIGNVLAAGLKEFATQAKSDAEQSRKLLDQKLGTLTKDKDKQKELEEGFATDEKFRGQMRTIDPEKTKKDVEAEIKTVKQSMSDMVAANVEIGTALTNIPGTTKAPSHVLGMDAVRDMGIAGTTKNSIFTHDTHVEAALISTNSLLADILTALGGDGVSRSGSGDGGGGEGKVGGMNTASGLVGALENFTSPADKLTGALSVFNTAFAGGMKWTLEAKHVIKIEGFDGLEIFNSLEGKFSELVRTITMKLINKELEDRIPQLIKKPPIAPMGADGSDSGAGD